MSEYDDLGYDVEELSSIFNKSKPDDQLFTRPPPSGPPADALTSPAESDGLHYRNARWKAPPSRGLGSTDEHVSTNLHNATTGRLTYCRRHLAGETIL